MKICTWQVSFVDKHFFLNLFSSKESQNRHSVTDQNVFILVCTYLNPFPTMNRMWHKVNFWVEYMFEFRVFLLQEGWLIKTKAPSLTYYLPITKGEQMRSCLSQEHYREVKQSRSVFELESAIPFLTTITVTLSALLYLYVFFSFGASLSSIGNKQSIIRESTGTVNVKCI